MKIAKFAMVVLLVTALCACSSSILVKGPFFTVVVPERFPIENSPQRVAFQGPECRVQIKWWPDGMAWRESMEASEMEGDEIISTWQETINGRAMEFTNAKNGQREKVYFKLQIDGGFIMGFGTIITSREPILEAARSIKITNENYFQEEH
ncbi:MAG: hypothetical protein GX421_03720 [Caldisericales bacterium]|nr:hypothetical protein [Caldisericales bacterium]